MGDIVHNDGGSVRQEDQMVGNIVSAVRKQRDELCSAHFDFNARVLGSLTTPTGLG